MPEICAAMGLANLESLDHFLEVNRINYDAYRLGMEDIPGIQLLRIEPTEEVNRQYVVAEVDSALFGLSRDQLGKLCHAENLMVRRYFHPGCHRMEPYKSLGRNHQPLSRTERLTDRVLVFPTGTQASPEDVARICSFLRFVQRKAGKIGRALESCAVA
jgi:dTDP-4-amino-4,6-dideoxygalactose transaminase